jgi:hypothetical protein
MTSAETLTHGLQQASANENFSEAILAMRDGSRLCFCHRVGERWAKAIEPPAGAAAPPQPTNLAAQLLAAIKMFRLNAKHLDIQFADGSRWDERVPAGSTQA